MVEAGLFESRAKAAAAIAAGLVRADGVLVAKASSPIRPSAAIEASAPHPYVSRGGVKLAAGLDAFAIDPAGLTCLDVGASTGGFTDALLQRGAVRVVAVDVGRDQLHARLRSDPRVASREGTDIRDLVREGHRSPLPGGSGIPTSPGLPQKPPSSFRDQGKVSTRSGDGWGATGLASHPVSAAPTLYDPQHDGVGSPTPSCSSRRDGEAESRGRTHATLPRAGASRRSPHPSRPPAEPPSPNRGRRTASPLVAIVRGEASPDASEMLDESDAVAQAVDSFDLIVCDASFAPLRVVLPPALALAGPGARLVALIKPQYEAGRGASKKGIVRDPAVHESVCREAEALVASLGWRVLGIVPSPIAGGDGNREFLLGASQADDVRHRG